MWSASALWFLCDTELLVCFVVDSTQGRRQDFRSGGDSPSLTSLPSSSHPSSSPLPFPPPSLPFPPPSRGPLPHYQLGSLEERCKLPQRGRRKRIFGRFCGSETYLMAAISSLCYAVQMTKFTQILIENKFVNISGG